MSDEARLRLERTEWRLACLSAEHERDAAIAERDRLRREMERLRDAVRERVSLFDGDTRRSGAELAHEARLIADRLNAILRGES